MLACAKDHRRALRIELGHQAPWPGVTLINELAISQLDQNLYSNRDDGDNAGRALLSALLDLAVRQGLARVTLSAQTHAIGFYEQAGFRIVGEPFMDAGIPHRKMVKDLLKPEAG